MATNPAAMTSLMPGANIGGSSVAVPSVPGSAYGTQSVGGNTNPFLPVPTSGTSMPPMTSPSFPANTGGGSTGTGLGGSSVYNLLGGGPNSGVPGDTGQSLQGVIKGLEKTGIPGGIASLLAGFLQSGAGFNPQVAQALIAAMGPQIERGTENIVEQFSALGNRFGSPAAVGLGDYMSQVNLNMDQIYANLYEQSVSNYLNILMGAGKKAPTFGSTFSQAFAGGLGSGLGGLITGT
jgi:hypothetical protein